MENVVETRHRGRHAERGDGNGSTVRGKEWRNLVADVEDLIKKVAHVDDADIAQVRAKVQNTLDRAKSAANQGVANVRGYAQDATRATDEYVHESPWAAIGIAAAAGAIIGFIAASRR